MGTRSISTTVYSLIVTSNKNERCRRAECSTKEISGPLVPEAQRDVRRNEREPIMWVTDDDTSILNHRGNVVREREVVGARFETDNGTDKTLSSIPG